MTVVHFARKHGIEDDESKIQGKHIQYLNDAEKSGTIPFMVPGAKEILELLKKNSKKIALLSSHPPENIRKEMEGYGLKEYFDYVLGGSTDKVKSLIEICRKFSVVPELSAYVGDMISDIQSAKVAKLLSVGIYSGYHMKEVLEKENPDYLIEDISKIVEIIQ
jgi:phosphoglycolate phosphatase-like HAD superfamily hydrolase